MCIWQWRIYPLTCCVAWRWEKESFGLAGELQAIELPSPAPLPKGSPPGVQHRQCHSCTPINNLAIIQVNLLLKGWRPQMFQPFPPPPHVSVEPAKHTNDPAACKSASFPWRPARVQEENGNDVGVVAPKRPSEQRNNQLHMSHSRTWHNREGLGLTPEKVTGIKGHTQKKATARGCQLQQASMWS